MRFMTLPAILTGLLAAGCATAAPPAEAPPAQQLGNTPPEDLDPFVVMIGAERWTVILERATEGAREASASPAALEESEMLRADIALKRGAAMVIELRNQVCAKGLVTGAACVLPEWPAWTRETPTGATPMAVIDQRSAWLSEVMDPFTTAGCEAGRKATGDDLFCSVE